MDASQDTDDLDRHRGYTSVGASPSKAIKFLAAMGFHLRSYQSTLNFKGDTVLNDDFVVARYSHDSAVFDYIPPPGQSSNNQLLLHVCLSGSIVLRSTTGSASLKPLDIALVQLEELRGAVCESSTAGMFIIYRSTEASKHYEMLAGPSNVVYLRILKAAAFSLLQDLPDRLQPGFTQIQRGLEEIAKATAIGAHLYTDADIDSLRKVYVRGLALIRSMATDGNTSIESVAQDLQVSRSYLLRAFKSQGTTPSVELRKARLHVAKRLLEDGTSTHEAAVTAGFGSPRNLKRALQLDN